MTFERIRVVGKTIFASADALSTIVLFSSRGIFREYFQRAAASYFTTIYE